MGASFSSIGNSLTLRSCTLWKTDCCPACRAVMMCLDAMHLSVTEHEVNMENSEHNKIIKSMNPGGTLPVFKNDSLILSDCHAITSYLAYQNNTAAAKKLLPIKPAARVRMIRQIFYNSGVLYPLYNEITKPLRYKDNICLTLRQLERIESSYEDVDNMLGNNAYLGGSIPSLGDILLCAYISTLDIMVPVDRYRWPELSDWLCRMSGERFYKTANQKGLQDFASLIGKESNSPGKGLDKYDGAQQCTSFIYSTTSSLANYLSASSVHWQAVQPTLPSMTLSGLRRAEVFGILGSLGSFDYTNPELTRLNSELSRLNSEMFRLKMRRKNYLSRK